MLSQRRRTRSAPCVCSSGGTEARGQAWGGNPAHAGDDRPPGVSLHEWASLLLCTGVPRGLDLHTAVCGVSGRRVCGASGRRWSMSVSHRPMALPSINAREERPSMANLHARAQLFERLLGVCEGVQHLTDHASALRAWPHGSCSHVASRVLHGGATFGALVVRFSWGWMPTVHGWRTMHEGERDEGTHRDTQVRKASKEHRAGHQPVSRRARGCGQGWLSASARGADRGAGGCDHGGDTLVRRPFPAAQYQTPFLAAFAPQTTDTTLYVRDSLSIPKSRQEQ